MRIGTYNLLFGGAGRVDDIHAVLAHCDADFIGLTEADDPAIVADLAERLGRHHIWAPGSGDRHIAALSRYPITHWEIHNRHPLAQAVLVTDLATPSGPLSLYTLHFLPYLLLPYELHRWWAVGALLKLIASRPAGPHAILGDINAIGPGDRVLQSRNPARMRRVQMLQLRLIFRLAVPRLLRAGYVDCFRRCQPHNDGFTWWTINPTTRYDYILADPTLAARLEGCQVVADHPAIPTASDHFPLVADFNF